MYIIPISIIVIISIITLGTKEISKKWIKRLKLISGLMILFLGFVLLFKPSLLENIITSFGLLITAVILSFFIISIREGRNKKTIKLTQFIKEEKAEDIKEGKAEESSEKSD